MGEGSGSVVDSGQTPPEVSRVVDTGVVTGGRRGAAGGTNDY